MKRFIPSLLTAALLAPVAAQAHDLWIEPSSTVLSGEQARIAVDAGSGNDKFYYNHRGLPLDTLVITDPGGERVKAENEFRGQLRSGFEVPLDKDGTYRIALVTEGGLFARWKEGGANKRWFGTAEEFDQKVPKDAQDLVVREQVQRVETFVTKGNPTELEFIKQGLALSGQTHPNDLYEGETAQFVLTLDGKPAQGIEVEVARGGSRYRNAVEDFTVKTDDQGRFQVTWPKAGLYWLHADVQDNKTSTPAASARGVAYVATLEVLPQ